MPLLLDTSLWIDFTRSRSPRVLKQQIAPYVLDSQAHLAEPVVFELLRFARPQEQLQLEQQFATLPVLETPQTLWRDAARLGQSCRAAGITLLSLDLLIGSLAIHHQATLVSFDRDFEAMARVSDLRVQVLERVG
jgi:predicted nucleic acid-binding protein